MSEPVLLYGVDNGLATITLNNPARRNAMSLEMTDRLDEALVAAATDPTVRVIVITGAGPAFCSGGDVDRLKDRAVGGQEQERSPIKPSEFFNVVPGIAPEFQTRYTFAMGLPVPVIAAVNGPAIGAGFLLALHCDIRFASTSAAFMTGFARIGATPEVGMAWTLSQTIGAGRAREMMLSGRRIGAEEAQAIGLVTQVLEPDALTSHTLNYARELAERISPRSVRVIKRQLHEAPAQTFAQAYFASGEDARVSLASEDFQEGLAALKERRAPRFTGR